MSERRAGSVLVIDEQQCLSGIFTGRDAVRTLAEGKEDPTLLDAICDLRSDGKQIIIADDSAA